MAITYKKIIAVKSVSFGFQVGEPSGGLAYGQTYEIESTTATGLIASGFAIDYDTALSNAKCPTIIRTETMRIG